MENWSKQHLSGEVCVYTSKEHGFGTDALLLADFAAPTRRALACDLGTGCGIIPLFWSSRGAGPALAFGLDIQEQAVAQFRAGAAASADGGVQLVPLRADLRQLPGELPRRQLDLVTCNPPYQAVGGPVPASPAEAAARHEILCTIDDVCAAAELLLKYGGRFCLCQKPERLCDVLCAMRAHRLEPKALRFVAKRAGDAPWLFLVEGKSGARPGMRLLEPLAVYEGEGYSRELRRIYGGQFGGSAPKPPPKGRTP